MKKKEKNENEKKRSKKLIFYIGFTAIIFIAATYAWFIGITQVTVDEFTIDIKGSDGLQISLDGITFGETVTISSDPADYNPETYPTNTNKWLNEEDDSDEDKNGLVPISSNGRMDSDSSRLILYSKTSIQSLKGGYRLRSTRIDNYSTNTTNVDGEEVTTMVPESDGYVVFDIFVKNNSGRNYDTTYNAENDEDIYLLSSSKVVTKVSDAVNKEIGIENSVRIAMMQIGRVSRFTTTDELTQSIKCAKKNSVYGDVDGETIPEFEEDEGIVSLCSRGTEEDDYSRTITWNIWEPNDTEHTEDSKQHFQKVCQNRTYEAGEEGESGTNTYSGTCTFPEEYQASYVVKENITSADDVNIYDGLNTYGTEGNGSIVKLNPLDTFTDTEKITDPVNNSKIPFFKLAPNSITKIRIYVYLEGQDVDNFDLTVDDDTKIAVSFGFTKDRYEYEYGDAGEGEEPEEGPEVPEP